MRNLIYGAWLLFFLLVCCYVVWTWVMRLASGDKAEPRWKAIVAVAGLCCATVSTSLYAFLCVHAVATGGYPYQHPAEVFCIWFGALMAILGIVSAIVGAGRLRGHVAIISIANFLLWFMAAMAQ